jgi:predicted SnoaL-like aldol condensation-catalyzing enzyme
MGSLDNKTALVTGASRGIGRATAQALADAGAHVVVHYGRAAAEAQTLVNSIRAAKGRADAVQADGSPALSFPLTAAPSCREEKMSETIESKNKALVLKAFDTLFNKRDYSAAEKFWSPQYIQHSAHIAPGREGLFNLVKSLPSTLRYEHGLIMAEGDFVIVHGRFSNFGLPVNWIAADILRIKNGILLEHWDVIQDEATRASSKSGLPMFGDHFPK